MPIKSENRKRYPPDWNAIRERILKRAQNRCELCGAPNGKTIMRLNSNGALWGDPDSPFFIQGGDPNQTHPVKIILTIAHLDPTYQCHKDTCLLALCQRCHLRIDAHFRHKDANSKREAGK